MVEKGMKRKLMKKCTDVFENQIGRKSPIPCPGRVPRWKGRSLMGGLRGPQGARGKKDLDKILKL